MTAWKRKGKEKYERAKDHLVLTEWWLFVMDRLVTRIHDVTVLELGAGDVFHPNYYRLDNVHLTRTVCS